MASMYSLTTCIDGELSTTMHRSPDDALNCLRENFDPEDDYADLDGAGLIHALQNDQGITVDICPQETP